MDENPVDEIDKNPVALWAGAIMSGVVKAEVLEYESPLKPLVGNCWELLIDIRDEVFPVLLPNVDATGLDPT